MRQVVFAIATSFLAFISCSEKEQIVQGSESPNNGDIIERVVFEVPSIKDGDDAETKASAVPGDGVVDFAWDVLDTIGIYPDKGSQVYFTMESGAGTNLAEFDGGGWALKPKSQYSSYYPFVGDIYLSRDRIPISFSGQKQIGTVGPFSGARYCLASEPTSSVNGELRFTYNTLNTIINVNATLPAGTYINVSLTLSEPLFTEYGTFGLNDQTISSVKYTNKLEMTLESFTLTEESTVPVYFMAAPVDLTGKEIEIRFLSSDGKQYTCTKTPSAPFLAGFRHGLICPMELVPDDDENIVFADADIKAKLVAAFDGNGDGEISFIEAAAVTSFDGVFGAIKTYKSFDEFQFFTGITEIPDEMFKEWQLTSITIPDSIVRIGYSAFKSCRYLTSIIIPDSVVYVGSSAFEDCSRLSSAILGNSVQLKPQKNSHSLSGFVFKDCTSLISINIPESVEGLGSQVFYGCSGLTSIIIPDSVTSIGDSAFDGCSKLESISIPGSVTSIGNSAFTNCSSLTSLSIPEAVTSIGLYAFKGCSSLSSPIVLPNTLGTIEKAVFQDCSNLVSVIIPDSVSSISESAFKGCSSLSSIRIPDTVTIIEKETFYGCSSLSSIRIPDTVTIIGEKAFYFCGLETVTIPASVTSLGSSAFFGCSSLVSITIPSSVTEIGSATFCQCYAITSVEIPESVISIGEKAFSNCTNLESVIIPDSVITIGKSAFFNCSNLLSATIGSSVESIGEQAFGQCYGLSSIIIPDSVITIGESAFSNCSNLLSVTIGNSVESIGRYSFNACSKLSEVTIWSVVPPSISSYTFSSNYFIIYVPAESVEIYKAAEYWRTYANKIYPIEQ